MNAKSRPTCNHEMQLPTAFESHNVKLDDKLMTSQNRVTAHISMQMTCGSEVK